MSVASRNSFALLNDDAGDDSIPIPTAAKPALAPAPAAAAPPAKDQKPRGPPSRGGRYYQRGGAKNVAKDTPETAEAEPNPKESRTYDNRGRGNRGRSRGRGAPSGRGRQFDRHSGTLPDTEKRVSQGWGANEGKAELTAETQAVADAAKDGSGDAAPADGGWGSWNAAPPVDGEATPAANGETRRPSKDEDENALTLDEYLAQKAKNEVVPKIESLRKANEGADEGQWKGAVPLSKDKEDENYFIGKTKATPKARAKKEEKVHIEIDARFERPSRGGGRGRGDRPPRGGRGYGPARVSSQTQQQPDVNVADQMAFPSLS